MSKKKIAEPRYKRGMTFSQTKKPTSAVSKFEYPFKFYEKNYKKDLWKVNSKMKYKPLYLERDIP